MVRVPFGTITITDEAKELIQKAVSTGRLSGGKYVREFEELFARQIGVKEAVAVNTGTAADALSLAVLHDFGASPGDEIIIPALTFVATANAVLHAGFKPVFVDIDRKTLNIDPDKIEENITDKTKAIMPVHLMGKPCYMDSINNIAKKHNLPVCEDAAESHGAKYDGRFTGALGDMGAFSLYVAHPLSTIEGGIVTTNNEKYAEVLRSLRAHGRACKCRVCVLNVNSKYCAKRFEYGDDDPRFHFERIGFSAKMNELEAAIGIGNMKIFDKIMGKRAENRKYMAEKLEEFGYCLYTTKEDKKEQMAPYAFPIIIKENAPFKRKQFVDFLEKNQIDTRSLFASIPTQYPAYKNTVHKLGDFPEAEFIGSNGIHLGVHQGLHQEHLDHIFNTIREFIKKNIG